MPEGVQVCWPDAEENGSFFEEAGVGAKAGSEYDAEQAEEEVHEEKLLLCILDMVTVLDIAGLGYLAVRRRGG